MQGTREGTDKDNIFENGIIAEAPRRMESHDGSSGSVEAIHTRRHLSTEVDGSTEESSRIQRSKHEGRKLITTRIIRKTTTLTRAEEQNINENLMRSAQSSVNMIPIGKAANFPAIQSKRARVSLCLT